tara:strand:+ start:432 stop:1298 length:867 start_codon:yes stop_codon:yes gene_type:complete
MLGLTNGLHYPNPPSGFSPLNYSDLIAWWDAGDIDTLWTDTSGTSTPSNGDDIARIDNKAYTLQGNTTNALGAFLAQSTASKCPHYISARSSIAFTKSAGHYLVGNISTGPVDTSGSFNVFSESTVNLRALTVFFVVDAATASLSAANGILHLKDANAYPSFEINGESAANHWIYESTNLGGTAYVGNSGVDTTTNVELWTVRLNGTSSNAIYRNGDTSDGITNGESPNTDLVFDVNNVKYFVYLGQVTNAAGSFGGEFYEMLIYNRALGQSEYEEIETNLKAKHNIS